MNTHNIELPPLPDLPAYSSEVFDREVRVVSETMAEQLMHDYARAAIEPYQRRIAELESQLEAIGAGGVSSQRITSQRRGEPVAWQWLDTAHFRKKIPSHSNAEEWRPLFTAPQPAESDEWKLAVDHELTNIHSTADSFPSAKEAVKALIDWHVAVATDPAFQQPAAPKFGEE